MPAEGQSGFGGGDSFGGNVGAGDVGGGFGGGGGYGGFGGFGGAGQGPGGRLGSTSGYSVGDTYGEFGNPLGNPGSAFGDQLGVDGLSRAIDFGIALTPLGILGLMGRLSPGAKMTTGQLISGIVRGQFDTPGAIAAAKAALSERANGRTSPNQAARDSISGVTGDLGYGFTAADRGREASVARSIYRSSRSGYRPRPGEVGFDANGNPLPPPQAQAARQELQRPQIQEFSAPMVPRGPGDPSIGLLSRNVEDSATSGLVTGTSVASNLNDYLRADGLA